MAELDRHTDPSGLLESLKAATDGRPFLGDAHAVEKMLRQFISRVLERYDEVGHGILTPNDAAKADSEECLALARVFCGMNADYASVQGWTGKPLADRLRQRMARDLVPDEDDVQVVAQALAVLVHSIYDLLRSAGDGDDSAMMQQAEASIRSLAMALVGVVGND